MSVVPVSHDTFGNHIRLLRVLLVEFLCGSTLSKVIGRRRVHADGVLVAVAKVLFLELEIALEPGIGQVVACVERSRRETAVATRRRVDSRVAASTASRRRGFMKTPS